MNEAKLRYKIETFDLAPDRFEIFAPRTHQLESTRREFWSTLGAGVLFVIAAQDATGQQPEHIGLRLHVASSGIITVLTGKVDIGQGLSTLLTQATAEELRVSPSSIRIHLADTASTPDDGGTWGSLTTPQTIPAVRLAAAALREALLDHAAQHWNVARTAIRIEDGRAHAGDRQPLFYTNLSGEVFRRSLAATVPLTPPAEWKVLGTSLPPVNGRDIVTGRRQYGSETRMPGMLHGKVLRPPAYRATLVSLDGSLAEKLPGVRVVRNGTLAGVVAPDDLTAQKALDLLKAEWKETPLPAPHEIFDHFRKTAEAPVLQRGSRYPAIIAQGSVEDAMRSASRTHSSTYTTAYIAHVPMECRSAIARWSGDELTVHCGTQAPQLVRRDLANAFRIPLSKIRIVVSPTGGGFGGKHNGECEVEAAALARAAGKPVRLAWSREDEFLAGYFRPAALIDVRTALDTDHKITAWDFHNYNAGAAGIAVPYAIPNIYCGFHKCDSPLRQGSYRSLAAVANTFARECHMDELAHLAKSSPLDYRLAHTTDERLRHVLREGAKRFGWKPGARTTGLACTIEKEARLALFAELHPSKPLRVARLVMFFDCGAILNPGNLHNQLTGAIIQGLGGALFETVRHDRRQVSSSKLSAYRVPRFSDLPEIEVHLIDRREIAPAGAGEAGITLVAPAVANAWFALTGERNRSLPLNQSYPTEQRA